MNYDVTFDKGIFENMVYRRYSLRYFCDLKVLIVCKIKYLVCNIFELCYLIFY